VEGMTKAKKQGKVVGVGGGAKPPTMGS
jgi:hypothetical protein